MIPLKKIIKPISLGMSVTFTIFTILTTVPAEVFASKGAVSEARLFQDNANSERELIPKEFGSVEKIFQGDKNRPTIYYIQDAHNSLEAQENIAKAVSYLVEKKGVRKVLVEGYEGEEDLDRLFPIENSKKKKQTAHFFMDYLRLTGAEYAYVTRSKDFQIIGVENYEDYTANLKDYQDASENRTIIRKELDGISKQLKRLGSRLYSKEIKQYQKLRKRFEAKKISLADYVWRLLKIYSQAHGAWRMEKNLYPNLFLVAENLHEKKLTKEEERGLNKKLEAVDAKEFFDELNHFEADYTERFLKTPAAEKNFFYQKGVLLLEKLNNLSLTPKEYTVLRTKYKELESKEVGQFLANQLKRPVLLKKSWEVLIQRAYQFYEMASARDISFQNNIRSALKFHSSNLSPIVVVTGGFHTPGLTKYFEEEKISYQLIAPRITKPDFKHEERYEFLMTGEYYPFEKPFLMAVQAILQWRLINEAGEDLDISSLTQAASMSIDPKTGLVDPGKIKINFAILKTQALQKVVEQMRAAALGKENLKLPNSDLEPTPMSDEEYFEETSKTIQEEGLEPGSKVIGKILKKRTKVLIGALVGMIFLFGFPYFILSYLAPGKIVGGSEYFAVTSTVMIITFGAMWVHELGHWAYAFFQRKAFENVKFYPSLGATVVSWGGVDAAKPRIHIMSGIAGPAANLGFALVAFALALGFKQGVLHKFFEIATLLNLGLTLFNLMPVSKAADGYRIFAHAWSEGILRKVRSIYGLDNAKRFDASYLYTRRDKEVQDLFEREGTIYLIVRSKTKKPSDVFSKELKISDVRPEKNSKNYYMNIPVPVMGQLVMNGEEEPTFSFGFKRYAVYRLGKANLANNLFYSWLARQRTSSEAMSLGEERQWREIADTLKEMRFPPYNFLKDTPIKAAEYWGLFQSEWERFQSRREAVSQAEQAEYEKLYRLFEERFKRLAERMKWIFAVDDLVEDIHALTKKVDRQTQTDPAELQFEYSNLFARYNDLVKGDQAPFRIKDTRYFDRAFVRLSGELNKIQNVILPPSKESDAADYEVVEDAAPPEETSPKIERVREVKERSLPAATTSIDWKAFGKNLLAALALSGIFYLVLPANTATLTLAFVAPLLMLFFMKWNWKSLLFFGGATLLLSTFMPIPWLGLSIATIFFAKVFLDRRSEKRSGDIRRIKASLKEAVKIETERKSRKKAGAKKEDLKQQQKFASPSAQKATKKGLTKTAWSPDILKILAETLQKLGVKGGKGAQAVQIDTKTLFDAMYGFQDLQSEAKDAEADAKNRLRFVVFGKLQEIVSGKMTQEDLGLFMDPSEMGPKKAVEYLSQWKMLHLKHEAAKTAMNGSASKQQNFLTGEDVYLVSLEDDQFARVSSAAGKLFGVPSQGMEGQPFFYFLPAKQLSGEDSDTAFFNLKKRTLEEGDQFTEWSFQKRTGEKFQMGVGSAVVSSSDKSRFQMVMAQVPSDIELEYAVRKMVSKTHESDLVQRKLKELKVSHDIPVLKIIRELVGEYYEVPPEKILQSQMRLHLARIVEEIKEDERNHGKGNPEQYLLAGQIELFFRNYESAEDYFEKAVHYGKQNANTFLTLGLLRHESKKWEKAVQTYKTSLEMREKSTDKSVKAWILLNKLLLEKAKKQISLEGTGGETVRKEKDTGFSSDETGDLDLGSEGLSLGAEVLLEKIREKGPEPGRGFELYELLKKRYEFLDPKDADAIRDLEDDLVYMLRNWGQWRYQAKETPKIVISIIHYVSPGAGEQTEKLLQNLALIDDSGFDYEIHILDNGSPDDFSKKMSALLDDAQQGKYPEVGEYGSEFTKLLWENRIKLFQSQTNLGYTGGNNFLFRRGLEADADYVFNINNDAALEKDLLKKLVEVAKNDEAIGAVTPQVDPATDPSRIYGSGLLDGENKKRAEEATARFIRRERWYETRGEYGDGKKPLYWGEPKMLGTAFMIRSDVIRMIGGFDTRLFMYGDEADIGVKILNTGLKKVQRTDTFIIHPYRKSSYQAYFCWRNHMFIPEYHDGSIYDLYEISNKFLVSQPFNLYNFGSFQKWTDEHLRDGNYRELILAIKGLFDGIRGRYVPTKEGGARNEAKQIENILNDWKSKDANYVIRNLLFEEDPIVSVLKVKAFIRWIADTKFEKPYLIENLEDTFLVAAIEALGQRWWDWIESGKKSAEEIAEIRRDMTALFEKTTSSFDFEERVRRPKEISVSFDFDLSGTTKARLFHVIEKLREDLQTSGKVKAVNISSISTKINHKAVYRLDLIMTDGAEQFSKSFETDIYINEYGFMSLELAGLSRSIASRILNLGRHIDIDTHQNPLQALGFSLQEQEEIKRRLMKVFRDQIEKEYFYFKNRETDTWVWVNEGNNYAVKGIGSKDRYEHAVEGSDWFGDIAIKFAPLEDLVIKVDTRIKIISSPESGTQVFQGILQNGKKITVKRVGEEIIVLDSETGARAQKPDGLILEEGSAFQPLDFEVRTVVTREGEQESHLVQRIKIPRSIAQKLVPRLVESTVDPAGKIELEGILIDLIKEKRIKELKYFIDQFFALVLNSWQHGIFDLNFKFSKVALDPSFGELGLVSFGKDYKMPMTEVSFISLGLMTWMLLNVQMERTGRYSPEEKEDVLNYYREGLRKRLKIIPGQLDSPVLPDWEIPEYEKKIVGISKEKKPVFYFGPGYIRNEQRTEVSDYIGDLLRQDASGALEERFRRRLADSNLELARYFSLVLSTLAPENFSPRSGEVVEKNVVQVYESVPQPTLSEVLDSKKFEGRELSEAELKQLPGKVVEALIYFFGYDNKLYQYIAGKLGLKKEINYYNFFELRDAIDQLSELPQKKIYDDIVELLRLRSEYEAETLETFKEKLIKGFKAAKHRKVFPSWQNFSLNHISVHEGADKKLAVSVRDFGSLVLYRREYSIYKQIQSLTRLSFDEIVEAIAKTLSEEGAYTFFSRVYYQADKKDGIREKIANRFQKSDNKSFWSAMFAGLMRLFRSKQPVASVSVKPASVEETKRSEGAKSDKGENASLGEEKIVAQIEELWPVQLKWGDVVLLFGERASQYEEALKYYQVREEDVVKAKLLGQSSEKTINRAIVTMLNDDYSNVEFREEVLRFLFKAFSSSGYAYFLVPGVDFSKDGSARRNLINHIESFMRSYRGEVHFRLPDYGGASGIFLDFISEEDIPKLQMAAPASQPETQKIQIAVVDDDSRSLGAAEQVMDQLPLRVMSVRDFSAYWEWWRRGTMPAPDQAKQVELIKTAVSRLEHVPDDKSLFVSDLTYVFIKRKLLLEKEWLVEYGGFPGPISELVKTRLQIVFRTLLQIVDRVHRENPTNFMFAYKLDTALLKYINFVEELKERFWTDRESPFFDEENKALRVLDVQFEHVLSTEIDPDGELPRWKNTLYLAVFMRSLLKHTISLSPYLSIDKILDQLPLKTIDYQNFTDYWHSLLNRSNVKIFLDSNADLINSALAENLTTTDDFGNFFIKLQSEFLRRKLTLLQEDLPASLAIDPEAKKQMQFAADLIRFMIDLEEKRSSGGLLGVARISEVLSLYGKFLAHQKNALPLSDKLTAEEQQDVKKLSSYFDITLGEGRLAERFGIVEQAQSIFTSLLRSEQQRLVEEVLSDLSWDGDAVTWSDFIDFREVFVQKRWPGFDKERQGDLVKEAILKHVSSENISREFYVLLEITFLQYQLMLIEADFSRRSKSFSRNEIQTAFHLLNFILNLWIKQNPGIPLEEEAILGVLLRYQKFINREGTSLYYPLSPLDLPENLDLKRVSEFLDYALKVDTSLRASAEQTILILAEIAFRKASDTLPEEGGDTLWGEDFFDDSLDAYLKEFPEDFMDDEDVDSSQSLGMAVESRVETDMKKDMIRIFDIFDSTQVEVDIVFNPLPTDKFRFSHAIRKGGFQEADWRSLDELSGELHQVHLPWQKLLEPVSEKVRQDKKNIYGYSASNVYWNDWFSIFDGNTRKLYYSRGEPFGKRTYSMLVIWKDGSVSAERLRFRQEMDGTFSVFREDNFEEELSSQIKKAVFGQQLVRGGRTVPLLDISHQFEDVYQIFHLPQVVDISQKGIKQYEGQIEIGAAELREGSKRPIEAEERGALQEAIKSNGYAEFDLTPYLNQVPEENPYATPLEYIEERALKARGYLRAPPQVPEKMKEGEYFIENNVLHVRLIWASYPHTLVGITQSGKVVSAVFPGDKTKGKGYTLKELSNFVIRKFQDADPIQDLFLAANSRDVFKSVNGVMDKGWASTDVYREGTAMIVFVAPPDSLESVEDTVNGVPVKFMHHLPLSTRNYLLSVLSQDGIIQNLIKEPSGTVTEIRVQAEKGYAYKNLFKASLIFEDGTDEEFDVELYGQEYGINPEEKLTLEEAVAAQIINLARNFDIENSKKLFDELGLGERITYEGLIRNFENIFRGAIARDTFRYQGQGSDAVVWANDKKYYVVKSLVTESDSHRYRNYLNAKDKLGGIAVKFTTMRDLPIRVDTGIKILSVEEIGKDQIIYRGADSQGKEWLVERVRKGAGYQVLISDERGRSVSAFEPLLGNTDSSVYGYEITDVFPEERDGEAILIAKTKIQDAVVQKFTPILLEDYEDPETGKTRQRGVLIDLMNEGRTEEILHLLDQFFALVLGVWRRNFYEYNFDFDNVALDLSFGELGFIDFGKSNYGEDRASHLEEQASLHLGMFIRHKLKLAAKQTEFKDAEMFLRYYDENLEKHLKIKREFDHPSWAEEDIYQTLMGPFDDEVGINYFGPGEIRKGQLAGLAAKIRNLIRLQNISEKTLQRNLARLNAKNEKYFVDILSLLIPKHIDVRVPYIFDGDEKASFVARIFPSKNEPTLEEVLTTGQFNGEVLTETEDKNLREQIAQIAINFFSYNHRLYFYVAERLELDSSINPDDSIQLEEALRRITQKPSEELYEEILDLLKVDTDYPNDTADDFRRKLLHGLRLAEHKKSFPSALTRSDFVVREDGEGNRLVVLKDFGPLLLHRREHQIYKEIEKLTGLSLSEIANAIAPIISKESTIAFFERIHFQAVDGSLIQKEIDEWAEGIKKNSITSVLRRVKRGVQKKVGQVQDSHQTSEGADDSSKSLGAEETFPVPEKKTSDYTYKFRLKAFNHDVIKYMKEKLADSGRSLSEPFTVVDLGIGDSGAPTTFEFFQALKDAGFEKVNLIGVDQKLENITKAAQEAKKAKLSGIEFKQGGFDLLKLGISNVDLIIVSNVLLHYEDQERQRARNYMMAALNEEGVLFDVTGPFSPLDVHISYRIYSKKGEVISRAKTLTRSDMLEAMNVFWKTGGVSLGEERVYQSSAELRADIDRNITERVPVFIHMKDLSELPQEDIEELIFYILRGQAKVIVYGAGEVDFSLSDIDSGLASLKDEGLSEFRGNEAEAYKKYQTDIDDKAIHLSKNIEVAQRKNNIRFRYQNAVVGTLTAAIAYLINDEKLDGVARDGQGYLVLDLANRLAELVREYQADFTLARAA